MTALVVRTDANRLPLADGTVDLVVTSPPYFALRSYQDGGQHYAGQVGDEASSGEFIDALLAVTAECVRVLKPSGSIWVNLGDKYGGPGSGPQGATGGRADRTQAATYSRGASVGRDKSLMGLPWRYALGCLDQLGLVLRAEVIWSKPNGMPEGVKDRVKRAHEHVFHFTKGTNYFASLDAVREPATADRRPGRGTGRWATGITDVVGAHAASTDKKGRLNQYANPLGSVPGSVWTIPTQPLNVPAHVGAEHFAAFPAELPRRIIRGWCPPSGVVLDCFGGTGTTALVASTLGRVGISCDLSHDYSRLARWRTTDPGERAKAMCVDKPPVEVDGQADLFGEVAS